MMIQWLILTSLLSAVTAVKHSQLLAEPPVRICSFNVRIFGLNKMKNQLVVDSLIQILEKYDITTIQEIRDSSEQAFPDLVKLLNQRTDEGKYEYVVSKRLGRSTSKEQYGFIYRADRVKLLDTYQYEDGPDDGTDDFEREPYAALFQVNDAEVETFSIISVHTKPLDAANETDKLTLVYQAVSEYWKNPNSIIAGDFNSDCKFVDSEDWANVALWTDPRYKWIINRCQDTTVTKTDCAYDRFVVAGKKLQEAVVPNSNRVVRFDLDLGLTNDEALKVSDHYPIEMEIAGKAIRGVQTNLETSTGFTITESKFASPESLERLALASHSKFDIVVTRANGQLYEVIASVDRIKSVGDYIQIFRNEFPDVVSEKLDRGLQSYAVSECFKNPSFVYGLKEKTGKTHQLEVRCHFQSLSCSVTATKRTS